MNRGVKVADGTLDALRRIARLPTKIRMKVADRGLADINTWLGQGGWRQVNGHVIEIDALFENKIELLRRAGLKGSSGGYRRGAAHPGRALRALPALPGGP